MTKSHNNPGGEIATLLLNEGLMTKEQLAYAERVHSKLASKKTLLNVIQELGYITQEQLRETLRKNQLSVRIGDLLVQLGYIREADLHVALAMQKDAKNRRKLGETLVEGGFIEEQKFIETLSYQMGFPMVEPEFLKLDRELLKLAPLSVCSENLFLPIAREDDGAILVAFVDPLDPRNRKAAEQHLGGKVRQGICSKKGCKEMLAALARGAGKENAATDESTIIGIINALFEDALHDNASDIHIEPMKDRLRIRFRRDGVLTHYKDFPREMALQLSTRMKVLAKADIAEKRRHQDGRILYESDKLGLALDMRVSFYVTIYGEKIVLRLLNKKGELLDIKDIGMAPRMVERFVMDALDTPTGVMIITGPTGSGKTTTLYSCVNYLNDIHRSIVTAEDPVEYVIDGVSQCSINAKIGVTFEETLRHIVRQDPDVIVLGEIRDQFSAETAIQAALTGHKVLTTFHTEDSIGGLIRLLNMEIEAFLISSTVVCVVAQRLLRRVCPSCSEPYTPTPSELGRMGYTLADVAGADFRIGKGCKSCRFTGYRGRAGVFELLILNEMVKDALLNKKSSYEIRRISTETSGLVTLLEDGIVKAASGLVSIPEVLRHLPRMDRARPLSELKRLLGVQ